MEETRQARHVIPMRSRWRESWPDAIAFLLGLALAWHFGWKAGDLVWSLWLSSLVVGYATIVWIVLRPWWQRNGTLQPGGKPASVLASLFTLAFFTVHFGGFHFVHSMFLGNFFPVGAAPGAGDSGLAGLSMYAEVVRRYWPFVPLAFIAERKAFLARGESGDGGTDAAVVDRAGMSVSGKAMNAPYRNVVRMHLLIFFFAAVHFAGLESFPVYAVVYAVYFFPWRLLKRAPAVAKVPRVRPPNRGRRTLRK